MGVDGWAASGLDATSHMNQEEGRVFPMVAVRLDRHPEKEVTAISLD